MIDGEKWKLRYHELMKAIEAADKSGDDWRKVLGPVFKAHCKRIEVGKVEEKEVGLIDGKIMDEVLTLMLPDCSGDELTTVIAIRDDMLRGGEFNVDIQPPARIEAAIRFFEKRGKRFPQGYTRCKHHADLLRWALTGEKGQETWKDKELGLEEET